MTQKDLFYISRKNYKEIYALSCDDYAGALLACEEGNYEKAQVILEDMKEQSSYVLLLLLRVYGNLQDATPPPEKIQNIVDKLLTREHDYTFTFELTLILVSYSFYDEAEILFEKLLKQEPYSKELWLNYALAHKYTNDEKSLAIVEKAYHHFLEYKQELEKEKNPSKEKEELLNALDDFLYMRLVVELAYLNFRLYRYDNALNVFKKVENYNAKNPQFFLFYALTLEYTGYYDKAYKCYKRAISLNADIYTSFEFSKFCLRLGRFEEGFLYYETRLHAASKFTFSQRHYDAAYAAFYENKNFLHGKKVLVYCEQGYGDTIMFSRILRSLSKVAKEVIFCPQSALFSLFNTHIQTLQKQNKIQSNLKVFAQIPQDFDYAVPICSLYFFLGVYNAKTIAKLPSPLISVEKKTRMQRAKVGICFRTSTIPHTQSLFYRNIDLEFLLEAFDGLDVELVNFTLYQKGELELPANIKDVSFELNDWLATSEALREVDLLVSIDSAIAHLSLALGIPTLVLLGDRFDWRWGKIESPKSIFWQKAHFCRVNQEGPSGIKKQICKILNYKVP
ncbi:hypothetical protein CAUP111243_05845 [Campylobacter upsaliensis]|uniref:TPR repeat-containing protein n=1 Tax=Campylobacter upsaliensis TaxID=28080 RepID=A0A448KQ27_CAMUP|nr:hypothetical protein [Campylobacter upsaliensis]MCA5589250.1 hypothetical protein [Campylobacter upsaliensis]VEG85501.1 TPR repeat-containing protein [Campylobacter upsaliensis]